MFWGRKPSRWRKRHGIDGLRPNPLHGAIGQRAGVDCRIERVHSCGKSRKALLRRCRRPARRPNRSPRLSSTRRHRRLHGSRSGFRLNRRRCRPISTARRLPGQTRRSTRPAGIVPGQRLARPTLPGGSRPRPTGPRSMPPSPGSSRSGFATPPHRSTASPRRGGFLRPDVDRLKNEIAALRTVPRPKSTSILTKSPVARPTSSDEFHFELHRNRVCYIDLNHLLELAKADAQVRIRMSDRTGLINSQVGPVGSLSLSYVLGRANFGIDELIQRQSIRFDLKGWEITRPVGTAGRNLRGRAGTRSPSTPEPSTGLPPVAHGRLRYTPIASPFTAVFARADSQQLHRCRPPPCLKA